MPLQPSKGLLESRFEQGRYLGPMAGSNTVLVGTASGVVKSPNIQTIAARRTTDWQVAGTKHRAANCHQMHWETMAAESAPERLCVPNFGRCDERRCTELTLSSLRRGAAWEECGEGRRREGREGGEGEAAGGRLARGAGRGLEEGGGRGGRGGRGEGAAGEGAAGE